MSGDLRLAALRRFAVAITILNLLGQTVLGFEQAWAHLVVSVATAYAMELLLEGVDAWTRRRRPRFAGGSGNLINFLLSAHVTGCAVAMLLYANARLLPVAFAAAAAIASKHLFRATDASGGSRHFLNPSNFGITATLLLFPSVGIAPPYQFTENLYGAGDWILPAIIVCSGTFLNGRFTRRLPLIAGWLIAFMLQAGIRAIFLNASFGAALLPMTGMAFVLFTFYMITDPATTPIDAPGQIGFGAAVAAIYGVLVSLHVVFGLFFALTIVTACRGVRMMVSRAVIARERVVSGLAIEGTSA
ncbi:MAG TPA: enediyne biosynthesis protein UnbU [Thermoanaerobaculia bacterium]|nr:enediyne biosynthesis protein UnbU [Thermoanaerobaculia bacterium]